MIRPATYPTLSAIHRRQRAQSRLGVVMLAASVLCVASFMVAALATSGALVGAAILSAAVHAGVAVAALVQGIDA